MNVEVTGLYNHYGNEHALLDVSFRMGQGRLVGLLEPSGGDKTSLLRLLAGLTVPDN